MRTLVLTLTAVLALSACDSAGPGPPPQSPAMAGPTLVTAGAESDPRPVLDELARSFALALERPAVRAEVLHDLAASRHTVEHELHFQDYLDAQAASRSGLLRKWMARSTDRTPEAVLRLAHMAPELEFYLPIPEHRARWRGTPEILVATFVEDDDVPTAFDTAGESVALTAFSAPERVTLSLVPVETDFSEEVPASVANVGGSGTIGTWESPEGSLMENCFPEGGLMPEPCSGGGGGGGSGGGSSYPAGLYLTSVTLDDDKEPPLRGAPEIEVFVITATSYGSYLPQNAECDAGNDHPSGGYRRFDQNSLTWNGNALILTDAQLQEFETSDPNSADRAYAVQIWEDDYKACELYTSMNVGTFIKNTALGGGAIAFGWFVNSPVSVPVFLWGVVNIGSTTLAAIYTNDDFAGVAISRETVSNPGNSGYSHILFENESGSDRNGAINLVRRN